MSSFKFVQPENAEELTFSTEFEMVTEVNAGHSLNASVSIVFTVFGIVIDVNPVFLKLS